MIGLENVSFSYPERLVLRNFSLRLPEQGVYCLAGPSGCGKTTVLHLLAGLLRPASGRVMSLPATLLFQEDRLLPWSTAQQNVALVLTGQNVDERAAYWLDAVGLREEKNAYPAALSGGMKRRVAIARALAMGGSLLLLDEPFTGLDAAARDTCIRLLRERFADGCTLLVSHLPQDAVDMGAVSYDFFALQGK